MATYRVARYPADGRRPTVVFSTDSYELAEANKKITEDAERRAYEARADQGDTDKQPDEIVIINS